MTAKREPAPPEIGDWILYAAALPRRVSRHPLGGPYHGGMLTKRGVGGWNVSPHESGGSSVFVFDTSIRRIYLTRGEAYLALRDLEIAIAAYDDELKTLLPRYQARVAGILSI